MRDSHSFDFTVQHVPIGPNRAGLRLNGSRRFNVTGVTPQPSDAEPQRFHQLILKRSFFQAGAASEYGTIDHDPDLPGKVCYRLFFPGELGTGGCIASDEAIKGVIQEVPGKDWALIADANGSCPDWFHCAKLMALMCPPMEA